MRAPHQRSGRDRFNHRAHSEFRTNCLGQLLNGRFAGAVFDLDPNLDASQIAGLRIGDVLVDDDQVLAGAGVPQLIGLLAHVPTKNPCSEA